MELSVIFPCYNEEENIEVTVDLALTALREQYPVFEIVLVNDASTDSTGKLCDQLAAAHREIRVLHNPLNVGQGASLVRGFREARYEMITHNAMDYPFDLADLRKLAPCLREADIVVAARRSRGGYSFYRVITSVVHNRLLRLLFPLKLRDYSFIQLIPRAVWNTLGVESTSTAFMMPEALIRAYDQGYKIREVESEYYPRIKGVATSGHPKVIYSALRDMGWFWLRRALGRTSRPVVLRGQQEWR